MEGFVSFVEQYVAFEVVLVILGLIGLLLAFKLVAGILRVAVILGVVAVLVAMIFPQTGIGDQLTQLVSGVDFEAAKDQVGSVVDKVKDLSGGQ